MLGIEKKCVTLRKMKECPMVSISTYEDLISINSELAKLFLSPENATDLIASICGDVKDWVNKHNKQYWEVVRFVCEKHKWLGIEKKDKTIRLKRKDFALILLTFCPNAIEEGETWTALKSSMEHYPNNVGFQNPNIKPQGNLAQIDVQEVEKMLNKKSVENTTVLAISTMEERVLEYLKNENKKQSGDYPKFVIKCTPLYEDVSPSIAVEYYKSERLHQEGSPSYIEAYEFVEEKLTLSRLNEFVGQYCGKMNIKLYVVSSWGLEAKVRAAALNKSIGYVRLNPNLPMKSDGYVLQRKVASYEQFRQLDDRLMWRDTMDIPLLIMNGNMLTTSFTDVTYSIVGKINVQPQLRAPSLDNEKIEFLTQTMVEPIVEKGCYQYKNPDVSIYVDPFDIAAQHGLTFETKLMDEQNLLGQLDLKNNHVILNHTGTQHPERFRFTMAHELGHFMLHVPWLHECNIHSIDDTDETIGSEFWINKEETRRLECQANSFAATLLMPKDIMAILYVYYYKERITPWTGRQPQPLYYNPTQPETFLSYNYIVGNIAKRLWVSHEAVKFRLIALNLLKIG